jgi:hypothetical protein
MDHSGFLLLRAIRQLRAGLERRVLKKATKLPPVYTEGREKGCGRGGAGSRREPVEGQSVL